MTARRARRGLASAVPGARRRGLRATAAVAVLGTFAALALAADLIASDLPLLLHHRGHTYVLPCLTRPAALRGVDNRTLAATMGPDDWALFPPIRQGPTSIDRSGDLARLRPPSTTHPLGTDDAGRDVAARLLHGARRSLTLGLLAAAIAASLGVLLGLLATTSRALDAALTRTTTVLIALPALLVLLSARGLGGGASDLLGLALVIGLLRAAQIARPVRAEALRLASSDHLTATRALGASRLRLALRHTLPALLPTALSQAALAFGHAVALEATLSFLGAGTPPPNPSWGELLRQAHLYMSPWLILAPGVALAAVIAAAHRLAQTLAPPVVTQGTSQRDSLEQTAS